MSALWKLMPVRTRQAPGQSITPVTAQGVCCPAQFGYELHTNLQSVCGIAGTAQCRGCVSFPRTPYSGASALVRREMMHKVPEVQHIVHQNTCDSHCLTHHWKGVGHSSVSSSVCQCAVLHNLKESINNNRGCV